jgi:thiamine phosphate synthase YjbQ (UPF0047 family)
MLIAITTDEKRQIIELTEMVETQLSGSGIVKVFAKHTTTAITVADLDPGTDIDILTAIDKMTPSSNWNHPHDPSHFPDHLVVKSDRIGYKLALLKRSSNDRHLAEANIDRVKPTLKTKDRVNGYQKRLNIF